MNKLTALVFTTMVFSFGGISASFAANENDQAPQARDLSVQEMNSVVGAGQIYWYTTAPRTRLFQSDGYHRPHMRTVRRGGWHNIGRHNIRTGQRVQAWCQGYTMRQWHFNMPNYSIGIRCY